MNVNSSEFTFFIFVITALLLGAHAGGYFSEKLRQPRVFGEILVGVVLGPTLFGHFFPDQYSIVFQANPTFNAILGAFSQVGLLLLMFCSGSEICSIPLADGRKTAFFITLTGTLIPLLAGLLFLRFWDSDAHMGKAQNETAFALVFAIAVAVTSIPVISRILFDLGILKSAFSCIVLAAAVMEDILLYVLLALALSLVGGDYQNSFDLLRLSGLNTTARLSLTYHVVVTLAFLLAACYVRPIFLRRVGPAYHQQHACNNSVAFGLVFILMITALAIFLGISSIIGALTAGVIIGQQTQNLSPTFETIKNFSFAFFIPLYFVSVGLKLDLIRNFDPYFFTLFCVFACLVKLAGVYVGSRAAGEKHCGSLNLAVAMNARGAPGIVVAAVALGAGIINESFYTTLVLLSLLTSLLAGVWLNLVIRNKWPLL